jgi:predicted dehydrogenase
MRKDLSMTSPSRATFAIVGSGWRSDFFQRLARALPDRFAVTGVVTRSADRGGVVERTWSVPTFRSIADLLAATRPEFVIPCVPWAQAPATTIELVEAGIPVLTETPPGPDRNALVGLWSAVGDRDLVQVAEQYLRMPMHAARLTVLSSGAIGDVTNVQVSSTHLYHAISMIRGFLGLTFEPVTVSARSFSAPVVQPLAARGGWASTDRPEPATTTIATLDWGEGRSAVYDFTDNQWWNPLRHRRLVIRGTRGEIVDDDLIRLAEPGSVVQSAFVRRQTGYDLNLEGLEIQHITYNGEIVWRNDFLGAHLSEDDLAVVALLAEMVAWTRGEGPAPYPLAEGCQDHLISLAIEESLATGLPSTVISPPWSSS